MPVKNHGAILAGRTTKEVRRCSECCFVRMNSREGEWWKWTPSTLGGLIGGCDFADRVIQVITDIKSAV